MDGATHTPGPPVAVIKPRGRRPRRFKPGQVHGCLKLIELAGYGENQNPIWLAECQKCGNSVRVWTSTLHRKPGSCAGCRRLCSHPLFRTWSNMLVRCYHPQANTYRYYGARGIQVCDRWRNSFDAFAEDMGPKPSDKHSIDRINNDGNYEPGNCRWATASQQAKNKRHYNRTAIEIAGVTKSQTEWADFCGVSRQAISQHLAKHDPITALSRYPAIRELLAKEAAITSPSPVPTHNSTGASR